MTRWIFFTNRNQWLSTKQNKTNKNLKRASLITTYFMGDHHILLSFLICFCLSCYCFILFAFSPRLKALWCKWIGFRYERKNYDSIYFKRNEWSLSGLQIHRTILFSRQQVSTRREYCIKNVYSRKKPYRFRYEQWTERKKETMNKEKEKKPSTVWCKCVLVEWFCNSFRCCIFHTCSTQRLTVFPLHRFIHISSRLPIVSLVLSSKQILKLKLHCTKVFPL